MFFYLSASCQHTHTRQCVQNTHNCVTQMCVSVVFGVCVWSVCLECVNCVTQMCVCYKQELIVAGLAAEAAVCTKHTIVSRKCVGVCYKQELIVAGLAAEAAVSGYHADNVGPSLMGGFILIR